MPAALRCLYLHYSSRSADPRHSSVRTVVACYTCHTEANKLLSLHCLACCSWAALLTRFYINCNSESVL